MGNIKTRQVATSFGLATQLGIGHFAEATHEEKDEERFAKCGHDAFLLIAVSLGRQRGDCGLL